MRAAIGGALSLALLFLAACAGGAAPPTAPADPANSFVVRDARVFDGERVWPRATVVVRNGRIAAVGSRIKAPAGLEVLDGQGKTLMPGLIDGHVHVFPGAQAEALRFGVTTVLDMFSLGGADAYRAFEAQRRSLGRTDQADTWTSGMGVTPPGGHPSGLAAGMGVTMPALAAGGSADAFVAERMAGGSDYLKVFQDEGGPQRKLAAFPAAQLKAVVTAAHGRGKLAVIHVSDQNAAMQAAQAGGDGLAHMFDDAPASEAFVRTAKARGIFVIPTLSVLAGAAGAGEAAALSADAAVRPWLSPMQQGMLAQTFPRTDPEILANALESVGRLHRAGVPIIAGTDAPNPQTAHGPSLHQELTLLVRAGLSPTDALRAATAVPARVFSLGDRGRVSRGFRADLLLVEGDATSDVSATRRISRMWKNGYTVDRTVKPPPPRPASSTG